MLAALLFATTLTVGPERALSPEVNLMPAAASDPMIASAGKKTLLVWTHDRVLPPGQWQRPSTRGRFLGETRDFEIFPASFEGCGVTSDGDSFYACAWEERAFPIWRTIGRNGELGPLRKLDAQPGSWLIAATKSRLIFRSPDGGIVITDHDGRTILKEVKVAHGISSRLTRIGDDFYFLESERLRLPDSTYRFWLTRMTPAGETSSELVGTFANNGNFDLTAGGGRLLLSIFQGDGSREEVRGLLLTPGAPIPPLPELILLSTRRTVRGGNGWTVGWDGHEFGIATCDRKGNQLEASLTRVSLDGKTSGPEILAPGFGFWPNFFVTLGGKPTLVGTSNDTVNRTVAISARSFASMVHEKRQPGPFVTAEVVPVQHSVAFAGKLAVWSEGGEFATAIRARFMPDGRPFTIAPHERRYRSAAAAVTTRTGYVIAWWESGKGEHPPHVVLQQIDSKGAPLRRREVAGGPFDTFNSVKPSIASSGETIALVSSDRRDLYSVRLRFFDSTLEQVSPSPISEGAGAGPIDLAPLHTSASPPKPAEGVVVWDGRRYVVAWASNRFGEDAHFEVFDEHGAAGSLLDPPNLTWTKLQGSMRSSDVILAGTALEPPEWKVCLGISTLGGTPLGPARCTSRRSTDDWVVDIQPVLFQDLVVITDRNGDAYDVLAAPIGPYLDFVCISCTTAREERPAATTVDGRTYIAYERTDPAYDNVTRLFFREVTLDRK